MSLVWYSIEEQYEIPFVIYLFEGIHYRYIMVILNYQASKSSSVHISNAFNTDKDQILKIYLRWGMVAGGLADSHGWSGVVAAAEDMVDHIRGAWDEVFLCLLLQPQYPSGRSVSARSFTRHGSSESSFQTICTMKIRGGVQTVLFGILIFSSFHLFHSSAGFLYNACLYWSSKCKLCSFIRPFLHSNLSFFLFLLSVNIYLINISAYNSYKKPTCIKISYSRLYLQIYL